MTQNKMKELKHIGFAYSVALETGVLPMHFVCLEDASSYCKTNYSNTLFQIIPIPLFSYVEVTKESKEG